MPLSRTLLVACLIACCASLALARDRTLGTASAICKDQFSTIMKEQYAADTQCADLIKKAMNTAPKSDADCPNGAKADAGSAVQKCMAKDEVRRLGCATTASLRQTCNSSSMPVEPTSLQKKTAWALDAVLQTRQLIRHCSARTQQVLTKVMLTVC